MRVGFIQKLVLVIALLALLLLWGCESTDGRFCLEDIGKEFCDGRGERFDNIYSNGFDWTSFECFNEDRQFVKYKFTKAEINQCYNTSG